MPELPEVEVVRRGLERWVVGRTISDVAVHHPRAVRRHLAGAVDLSTRLRAATFDSATRRGKFLWLPLRTPQAPDPEFALVAHLGMSGQLLVVPRESEPETHLRVQIGFADGGRELRFVDQRTFGGVALDDLVVDAFGMAVPTSVAHIARDLLDPNFDAEATQRALRRRAQGVKRALLDQGLVSGIGNIYADEALWRARLHYATACQSLSRPVTLRLLDHARDVMAAALAQGGTSFDSLYVNVNGESGYFDRSLDAYGREHEPCHRCGSLIVREPWANRSSYRCPRCQRRPRHPSQ